MPTWKFYKGESKTFEGTVLISTMAGMTPTNYDITNATMGFDMGTAMGQWMIRTDSVIGSYGTNFLTNSDFSLGTAGWLEDSFGSSIYVETSVFTSPFATVLIIPIQGTVNPAILKYQTSYPFAAGAYYWRFDSKMGGNARNATIATITVPVGKGIGDILSKSSWSRFKGTNSTLINASNFVYVSFNYWGGAGDSATVYFDNFYLSRLIATSSFQIMTGTMGVYRYSFLPEDTENLAATSYYFDIWMRTPQNKEYTITVGTIQLLPVVGTM
jgi:hypothetical protein